LKLLRGSKSLDPVPVLQFLPERLEGMYVDASEGEDRESQRNGESLLHREWAVSRASRSTRYAATFALVIVMAVSSPGAAAADAGELLRKNDIAALEATLGELQRQFEQGSVSEIDLRNAYRPFYEPSPEARTNLFRWAKEKPASYAARLAEGIYYKKQGQKARGGRFISETPRGAIAKMEEYYAKAHVDLIASKKLTAKPYLSVFHLLDIAAQEGDIDESLALLKQANRLLPNNALARDRYFHSLMPRWGGSYPEAKAFIESAKAEHLPESVIMQLEAILEDDMGEALARDGNFAAGRPHFVAALSLSKKIGGSFRDDFLSFSTEYLCPREPAMEYCR